MTKEEFCARFKAEMLRLAGDDPDTAKYADEAAEATWNEPDQRIDGPEECARTDISYWEA